MSAKRAPSRQTRFDLQFPPETLVENRGHEGVKLCRSLGMEAFRHEINSLSESQSF